MEKKKHYFKNVYRVFVLKRVRPVIHSHLPINTVRDFSPETGGQRSLTKAIYFFECKRTVALTAVVYLGF